MKMPNAPNNNDHWLHEVLIVRITPQFLEQGSLWFSEHFASIKKSLKTSPLWNSSVLLLEQGASIKPSEALRLLTDFGYEKTTKIFGKGEFVWQGNMLEMWPINTEYPVRVEFFGNTIAEIVPCKREAARAEPRVSYRTSLEKLPPDSFIVHLDHGIGIFRGITTENEIKNPKPKIQNTFGNLDLEIGPSTTKSFSKKFFVVEYAPPRIGAAPDRLLVPEEQAKRLSPYIGFETPTIHRLGGTVWFAAKRKAKELAMLLAKELFELYRKRIAAKRPPYHIDPALAREFDEQCPFEETDDQRKATEESGNDLAGEKPMDRILCGDVGFGKTEVAMRVAFRAAMDGKQVALIAPTTILADQHARNFRERFSKTPVTIALLSRLTHSDEIKTVLKKTASGAIDILIGTHRILSKDIVFKNLGLAIVDEEQKFGVKQKERFKELRENIDILSLSATPIPRTLSFALARLRDISLIATPPRGRTPIKTFAMPYSQKLIREAVQEELNRDGQVYVLHNRVATIGTFKETLEKVLLTANSANKKMPPRVQGPSIGVIHGRMGEKELMRIMEKFRNQEIDILLATTIIENGLDVSNVNTLIIEDATKLGLSQAHQLRGRIGRGDRQAYAYFFYRTRNVTEKALERLTALQEYAELGAGYDIALRDLEIRGAGNILGKEQSGAVNKVGFNLYCQLLNETLDEMNAR